MRARLEPFSSFMKGAASRDLSALAVSAVTMMPKMLSRPLSLSSSARRRRLRLEKCSPTGCMGWLIDKEIQLRYDRHRHDTAAVVIYHKGQRMGAARLLDAVRL